MEHLVPDPEAIAVSLDALRISESPETKPNQKYPISLRLGAELGYRALRCRPINCD